MDNTNKTRIKIRGYWSISVKGHLIPSILNTNEGIINIPQALTNQAIRLDISGDGFKANIIKAEEDFYITLVKDGKRIEDSLMYLGEYRQDNKDEIVSNLKVIANKVISNNPAVKDTSLTAKKVNNLTFGKIIDRVNNYEKYPSNNNNKGIINQENFDPEGGNLNINLVESNLKIRKDENLTMISYVNPLIKHSNGIENEGELKATIGIINDEELKYFKSKYNSKS